MREKYEEGENNRIGKTTRYVKTITAGEEGRIEERREGSKRGGKDRKDEGRIEERGELHLT